VISGREPYISIDPSDLHLCVLGKSLDKTNMSRLGDSGIPCRQSWQRRTVVETADDVKGEKQFAAQRKSRVAFRRHTATIKVS